MINLSEFKENNLEVNWGTLLIGWNGVGFFQELLTLHEIQVFAECWLTTTDKYNELVVDILTIPTEKKIDIEDVLTKISRKECIDLNNEKRKWRYVMLIDLLKKLKQNKKDYLNGLIELTDFWAMFDFPSDSPHTVQGQCNKKSPLEYYTEKNFLRELDNHQKWLSEEFEKIKR